MWDLPAVDSILQTTDFQMIIMRQFFSKSRQFVLYGIIMAVLVFALKWLQWKFLITDNSSDIYVGIIALLFTGLGVWVALQLAKPKTVIVEKEIYIAMPETTEVNQSELDKLNLTTREYEVLQLLTRGCSNGEIADRLFLSLSTVKTHVSNLFVKMDVKNRTQAIGKANRLKLTR